MKKNLVLRIITALTLGSVALGIIFFGNHLSFLILISALIFFCSWEWFGFTKIQNLTYRLIWIASVGLFLLLSLNIMPEYWLVLGSLWWFLALFILWLFPEKNKYFFLNTTILINGLLLLIFLFQSAVYLYQNKALFLLFLLTIWLTDIGAYFVGKKFGKHKLIPKISPGKTIEGAIGGIVIASVFGSFYIWFFNGEFSLKNLAALILVAGFSIVGDLIISCYKRNANIKDSGNILPGHGGILDRLDSSFSAMPIFVIFFMIFYDK